MADKEKIMSDVKKKAKSKAKRKAKSKVKKIHLATIIISILCLAIGVFAGAFAYSFISADDGFYLKGDKEYTVPMGTSFTYYDEGAKVISFGQDISDRVRVETNLREVDDGEYTVDTSVPGDYYIIYRVDSIKYGEIMRVRTITVKGE